MQGRIFRYAFGTATNAPLMHGVIRWTQITMNEVGAVLLIISLLVNLVAAPYYFRKLHRFIKVLEKYEPETYESLGKPTLEKLGFNMSPSSSMSIVNYVWTRSYRDVVNDTVILLGNKAHRGLLISFSTTLIMFLGAALMMFGNGSV